VTLISAPAGFGKTTLVFAPSCIDIIKGIIKVTIDKIIQRLTTSHLKNVILSPSTRSG
jgi:hypothetical protein